MPIPTIHPPSISGHQKQPPATARWLSALLPPAMLILSAAIFLVDLLLPLGVAVGVCYAIVVALASRLPARRHVVLATLGCAALLMAGYAISPQGGPAELGIVNRLLALVTVMGLAGVLLVRGEHSGVRKASLLCREHRHGQVNPNPDLLPVCSSCKRIRDGEGAWEEWDTYLQDHFQTRVTHGLCPECIFRLYATQVSVPRYPSSSEPPGAHAGSATTSDVTGQDRFLRSSDPR